MIRISTFFKDLEGGRHDIVSSLIDKFVELKYGSLFTFLVVIKVTFCRAEKKSACSNFCLVEFKKPGESS